MRAKVDSVWKAWKVLNLGGGRELPARLLALKNQGFEVWRAQYIFLP